MGQHRPKNLTSWAMGLQPQKKESFFQLPIYCNKSYLKYEFILTGDSVAPCPLCLICNSKLSNETMKPSKLLWHMKTKHPELEDKLLKFFEKRKRDREGEKRLLRAALSTNSNALRASCLVSHRIAKSNKSCTIGKELILFASTDIFREVLGELAVKKDSASSSFGSHCCESK